MRNFVKCEPILSVIANLVALGVSTTVAHGGESETEGLANGDFKFVFRNWNINSVVDNPILTIAGFD